jgi:hypothetical protein
MPRQDELLSGFAGMQIAYTKGMGSKWALSPWKTPMGVILP